MNYRNFLLIIILFATGCNQQKDTQHQQVILNKKRILVMSLDIGQGHITAANAVKQSLNDSYDVVISDILNKKSLYTANAIFTSLSSREYWLLLDYAIRLKKMVDYIYNFSMKDTIRDYVLSQHPDMIISVIPMFNDILNDISIELNIPFAIIPTDFNGDNMGHWGYAGEAFVDNKKFRLYLPPEISDNNLSDSIKQKIAYIGYPVRKDFLSSNIHKRNMKDDLSIMIMMGGESWAFEAILQYIDIINERIDDIILADNKKITIYVPCGTNKDLFSIISNIKVDNRIVLKPLEWLNGAQVAEIMNKVNFVITKPGGSTTGELLSLNKLALIKPDSTKAMDWERKNLDILKKYDLAKEIEYFGVIRKYVEKDIFIKRINQLILQSQYQDTKTVENNFTYKMKNEVDLLFGL